MNDKVQYTVRTFGLYFIDAYYGLYERGLIDDDELERIQGLIDRLEDYPPDLFCERLVKIFGEKREQSG